VGGGLDLSYNNNQGKGQFPKLEMLGSNNLVRIFFISRKGAVKEQIRFFSTCFWCLSPFFDSVRSLPIPVHILTANNL
jgi:hypothetical protein